MGNFGQILINIVILDLFDYKNNSFFRFEKVEKFSGFFWEFREFFRKKSQDIKFQIFENSFLKKQ